MWPLCVSPHFFTQNSMALIVNLALHFRKGAASHWHHRPFIIRCSAFKSPLMSTLFIHRVRKMQRRDSFVAFYKRVLRNHCIVVGHVFISSTEIFEPLSSPTSRANIFTHGYRWVWGPLLSRGRPAFQQNNPTILFHV